MTPSSAYLNHHIQTTRLLQDLRKYRLDYIFILKKDLPLYYIITDQLSDYMISVYICIGMIGKLSQ